MLYPVAPDKIAVFKDKLSRAFDAEGLPKPSFHALKGTDEEVLEIAGRFLEGLTLTDPVDGFHAVRHRGRTFALVEVSWPEPLHDNNGDRVLYTGNVPVGPDPVAMWQLLFLLPET